MVIYLLVIAMNLTHLIVDVFIDPVQFKSFLFDILSTLIKVFNKSFHHLIRDISSLFVNPDHKVVDAEILIVVLQLKVCQDLEE